MTTISRFVSAVVAAAIVSYASSVFAPCGVVMTKENIAHGAPVALTGEVTVTAVRNGVVIEKISGSFDDGQLVDGTNEVLYASERWAAAGLVPVTVHR